jgi:tRNA modification GTPase
MIEAEIDFSDEDDVPGSVSDRVWADMRTMSDALSRHMDGERRGRIMRSGLQVAIVGAPNAGKSTLLNAMAGSDRAIVSPEPGTTRDVVEARLDLGGHLVVLADTAGLRDEAGTVEGEGIRRAIQRAAEADLVLHVSETGLFETLQLPDGPAVWTVRTKVDLTVEGARPVQAADYALSAVTGEGLGALVAALTDFARDGAGGSDLAPGRARHMQHLAACKVHLIDSLSEQLPLELRAEHLRLAGEQLGRITGRINVEDMLGTIFSQFCIGK